MSANHLIVAFEDENEQTLWGRNSLLKKFHGFHPLPEYKNGFLQKLKGLRLLLFLIL